MVEGTAQAGNSVQYLVHAHTLANVSVPYAHTSLIVTGHQTVFVVRVVRDTAAEQGRGGEEGKGRVGVRGGEVEGGGERREGGEWG